MSKKTRGGGRTFLLKSGHFEPHRFIDGVIKIFKTLAEGARGEATARPAYLPTVKSTPDAKRDRKAIHTIETVLGLNNYELAAVFRIKERGLQDWRNRGIPDMRRASVARLLDLALVLDRDIKRERIPEIIRTRDEWLPRGTILETLIHDGTEPVYAYLHRLFSYNG